MSDSLNNKELVAVGHHFAKAMSSDTPIMDIAKIVSRLAERLDCTTAVLHATQAQRDQLAVENAALKDGVTYFAYSPEYGFDYFASKQAAIDTAQEEIDAYREDADDGWSEDVQRVSWGIVMQQAQGFDAQGIHTSDNQHTYQTCDYRLVDAVQTPTTDAFLAGAVRAAVTLPTSYSVRPGHPINETERSVMIPKDGGQWLSRFDVEHALQTAGISIKGK